MEKPSVRQEISIVAGPREWGDTRESWLSRVHRKVPTVTFRTVKALWYGEIDDPNHWAARDIRRAAELVAARQEASALAFQLESIAGSLNAKDADFYRQDVSALIDTVSKIRGVDRAGIKGVKR